MTQTTEPIRFRTAEEFMARPRWKDGLDHHKHELLRILGDYDLPKAERLSCGLTGCRTPHQRGYVVETVDGLETHIGNRCGATHFGMLWGELNAQYKRAAEDRDRRNWLESVLAAKEPTLRRIDHILSQYIELKNELAPHFERINKEPSMVAAIARVLNQSGSIQVMREIDGKAAEASGLAPWQRRRIDTVGRLAGYESIAVIRLQNSNNQTLTTAREDLFRQLRSSVRPRYQELSHSSLHGANNRQRKKLADELERCAQLIGDAERAIENLRVFLSERNLRELGKLDVTRPNDRTARILRHYSALGDQKDVLPE